MSIEVAQMDAVGRLGVAIKRIELLRAALKEIDSWRQDTLGVRPKVRTKYDCPQEITEAFDSGARMAFYRCSDRARVALVDAE